MKKKVKKPVFANTIPKPNFGANNDLNSKVKTPIFANTIPKPNFDSNLRQRSNVDTVSASTSHGGQDENPMVMNGIQSSNSVSVDLPIEDQVAAISIDNKDEDEEKYRVVLKTTEKYFVNFSYFVFLGL